MPSTARPSHLGGRASGTWPDKEKSESGDEIDKKCVVSSEVPQTSEVHFRSRAGVSLCASPVPPSLLERACCASIWDKSVENVPKSVSRVCGSSAASAGCRDAPLARSVHSVGPRECTDPTGVSRLDAVLEMELQKVRRRACHERATEGVPAEVMKCET